jgi:DNA repair protein RecO (recombination protein O)
MTGVERLYDYCDIALDIDKFYHACHYAEIASSVIMEDNPDEDMLRLFLNTLHILVKNLMDPVLLTAVYEFRTAAISGLAPVMDECAVCGKKGEKMVFSYENQGMVCCCNGVEIKKDTAKMIGRICEGDMKDLFSITADRAVSVKLAAISKRYIEEVLERHFEKLKPLEDMYKGG